MEHQSYAYGKNHWSLEPDLPSILGRYWRGWTAYQPELERFGALAGGEAYRIADHVDKEARPVLVMHDLEGTASIGCGSRLPRRPSTANLPR